jgi:glycogen operon protein
LLEKHAELHRFVKSLIAARLRWDTTIPNQEMTLNRILSQARVQWHGVRLSQPDWGPDSRSLALTALSRRGRLLTHIMLNAYWEPLAFDLPPVQNLQGRGWHRWIDTARPSPDDIGSWANAPAVPGKTYLVQPRSVVVLMERITKETT